MTVTVDLFTALVVCIAVTAGVVVYRWGASSADASVATSKGERLLWAVAAAAAVVAIGSFVAQGVGGGEAPRRGVPSSTTGALRDRPQEPYGAVALSQLQRRGDGDEDGDAQSQGSIPQR
jgi:hypothetical protein